MSANMGKEKNMADSSYRKYQAAAQLNMTAFPLTSLKEENLFTKSTMQSVNNSVLYTEESNEAEMLQEPTYIETRHQSLEKRRKAIEKMMLDTTEKKQDSNKVLKIKR